MALTKVDKERLAQKTAKQTALAKAKKLQLTQLGVSAVVGFAEGYAESASISFVTEGFGPLKFEHMQAIGGYWLAMRKGGSPMSREAGSSLANIGLYKIGKGLGGGFSLGGLFGG